MEPLTRKRPWLPLAIAMGAVVLIALESAFAFLRGREGDFIHYHEAARALLAGRDIYLAHIQWYSYPPMLAVLLAPLGALSLAHAGAAWASINAGLFGLILVMTARELLRRMSVDPTIWATGIVCLVAVLVLGDKIRNVVRLGQSDAVVMLALFGALRYLGTRPARCGLLLAIATNVKYQGLIALPYLLVRRRWLEAMWSLVFAVVIALASSLIFGWDRNLQYLQRAFNGLAFVLGARTKDPTGPDLFPLHWERSIALPSALARLARALSLSDGQAKVLVVLGVAALASACVAIAWAMYQRHGLALFVGRGGARDDASPRARALVAAEWTGLVTAMLAFAPQTTTRHAVQALMLAMLAASVLVALDARRDLSHLRPRLRPWLIGALIALVLAFVLPPGGETFRAAQHAWRAISGPTIVMLGVYFVTLWATLKVARVLPAAPDHSSS